MEVKTAQKKIYDKEFKEQAIKPGRFFDLPRALML